MRKCSILRLECLVLEHFNITDAKLHERLEDVYEEIHERNCKGIGMRLLRKGEGLDRPHIRPVISIPLFSTTSFFFPKFLI